MRRPGGVDQYPDVTIQWKLHQPPVLHGYDAAGTEIGRVPLSALGSAQLHTLFGEHFRRADVPPPSLAVRTWRRLFGWAYGIGILEAIVLFAFGGLVALICAYTVCYRYTQCCDALADI